jgi:hypothetical protein
MFSDSLLRHGLTAGMRSGTMPCHSCSRLPFRRKFGHSSGDKNFNPLSYLFSFVQLFACDRAATVAQILDPGVKTL